VMQKDALRMGLEVVSQIDQPNPSNRASVIDYRRADVFQSPFSDTIETPIPVATIAKIVEKLASTRDGRIRGVAGLPPAPKLNVFGKLDPAKATAAELHGQVFGKGQCASRRQPPFYTDNFMHNLQAERFYRAQMINGTMATADGPIQTFPLRGIKDSPPYMHGRLLSLDDTVEFFNLALGTELTDQEKKDNRFLQTL
jgi:hypothetical protein